MRNIMCVILGLLFACRSQVDSAQISSGASLQWMTNYDAALSKAKASSRPLALFFTGSDWCGWCNKLEAEVLDTPEFINLAGNKFVFVKLDFPLYQNIDPALTSQNKSLQKRFNIRSFPTILLLDPNTLQQIGSVGYRPGGAGPYASYLLKMVGDFQSYKNKMQNVDKGKFSGLELRQMYEKARELHADHDASEIVRVGIKSDQRPFFLTERYRALVAGGLINEEEALILRQQLIKEDPYNIYMTHYKLAVIDFEAHCSAVEGESNQPEIAISPLLNYIEKFGSQDRNNAWRLQMIISQVFLDQDQLEEALKYAQSSYESAPVSIQPEIATAIKNIKTQIR